MRRAILLLVVLSCAQRRDARLTKVQRGQFAVAHSEDGELIAQETLTVSSRVRGEISYIAEDHSFVKKGDVVAELEKRDREERRKLDADRLAAAESRLSDRERNLEIQRANLGVELEKKRAAVRLCEVRLQQSDDLPLPEDLQVAEKSFQATMAALEQTESALRDAQDLHARGFVSQEELEADGFERELARIASERSRISMEATRRGATEHERKRLMLELERAKNARALAELQARSTLASLGQEVKWTRAEVSQCKEALRKSDEDIALRTIRAPCDGMVLRCRRHWERDKIDVGGRARPGRGIVEIPDLSTMRVETQIPESIITYFRVGDAVDVVVDDIEGGFDGRISWIDSWARDRNDNLAGADQEREGLSGVRVFRCHVDLAEKHPRMRLGSKARVMFRHVLEDVLHVDKRALVTSSGSPYLVVPRGKKVSWVPVERAQENERSAVIVSGAEEGMEVLLPEGGAG